MKLSQCLGDVTPSRSISSAAGLRSEARLYSVSHTRNRQGLQEPLGSGLLEDLLIAFR